MNKEKQLHNMLEDVQRWVGKSQLTVENNSKAYELLTDICSNKDNQKGYYDDIKSVQYVTEGNNYTEYVLQKLEQIYVNLAHITDNKHIDIDKDYRRELMKVKNKLGKVLTSQPNYNTLPRR